MTIRTLRASALALTLVSLGALQGCMGTRTVYVPTGGGGSGQSTLSVVNRANQALFYLYASSCSEDSWGPDRLGSETISSGETMSFTMTPGCWDLKARFQDGQEVQRRSVQFDPGETMTWTITS